jgi:hypothetical protein
MAGFGKGAGGMTLEIQSAVERYYAAVEAEDGYA